MLELVQITAQYSNAVLVAVMPYVSEFSRQMDLPVHKPVTTTQVSQFKCDPRLGEIGGALTLTNGFQFTFLDGRVCVYRSPESYFSLQDPEQIPRFYGPVKISEKKALKAARSAMKKLGFDSLVIDADGAPRVTPPEKIGTNYVARYRFQWLDPTWPGSRESGAAIPALLDVEVNASNRRIEMLAISDRDTRRPSPVVDVVPTPLHTKPPDRKIGGMQTVPVSAAYSQAFLVAILPQVSDFATKAGLDISIPITTNQINTAKFICRLRDGQPIAQLYLTNGDRFNYGQGHVKAFYAHDAFLKFPDTGRMEDFLGHINVTTNEAISLCEGVMMKLGYKGELTPPSISYAPGHGNYVFTRYNYYWRHTGQSDEFASFEVDMQTKRIKTAFLNDAAFQKEPPKIGIPPN